MPQRDEVNTPVLVLLGFLGAIATFAAILGIMVLYYHAAQREEYRKVIAQPWTESEDLKAQQQARLVEYRWVDKANNVVAVPIDRAMELVVANPTAPVGPGIEAQPQGDATPGKAVRSADDTPLDHEDAPQPGKPKSGNPQAKTSRPTEKPPQSTATDGPATEGPALLGPGRSEEGKN